MAHTVPTMLLVILLLVMNVVINVFGDDVLPLILVNRVELEIRKENGLNIATYNYLNGDFVDITCMHPHSTTHSFNVTIKGIKALHEILEVDQLSSQHCVGIQMILRNVHNGTTLICQKGGYTNDVMIKLVLQETFDDFIDLKINDLPIRSSRGLRDTKYKYYYLSSENLTLTCEANSNDVVVTESNGDNTEVNDSKKEKRYQWSKTPKEDSFLIFKANLSETTELKRSIEFKLLSYWYNEVSEILLSLDISTNNVLLNVYSINGCQYIIYEYEDNENITLTCFTTKAVIDRNYVLGLDEKVQGCTTSKSINIDLRADKNNTRHECYISQSVQAGLKVIRMITVYFYKSTETSNTSSGKSMAQADLDGRYWILLVLVPVVCVPIGIFIVRNKKKQRNLLIQKAENHHMDERTEDLYNEPNKPKPKNNKNTPDLNYAVLDIAPSTNVSRTVDNETALYAEVCHDSARYLR